MIGDRIALAIVGLGNRGNAYAGYTLRNPGEAEIKYVCDLNKDKLARFAERFGINKDNCFSDLDEMLDRMDGVGAVIISTLDAQHFEQTVKVVEKGYHVLLEKPMSPSPAECVKIGELSRKYGRMVMVCHVLRYTPFFSTIKGLLDTGTIGRLMSIQHNENVSYWHMSHSYVRGNFRNSNTTSPMILAKSCHDMDIMLWLAGRDCIKVSSFGSLSYFRSENAPEGSTNRCTDGCPHEKECPFSAAKIYLGENTAWPTSMISTDMSHEARLKALREGPYGRCVFRCDNNVVDHQVVNLLFEDDITAVFSMNGFNKLGSRTIKLVGTKGEIRGYMEKNEIEVRHFNTCRSEVYTPQLMAGDHNGGDTGIMRSFLDNLRKGDTEGGLTSARISVQSHLMAFAAEESRLSHKVMDINEFLSSLA